MLQKMNNEQIGVSSILSSTSTTSSTTAAVNRDRDIISSGSNSIGSSSSAAQLIKAISTGVGGSETGNATDTDIATLVTKIQAIIPDTPIVSIAAGTLSESTTTTTSTKTTPTPYFQEQLTTLMSHNVKLEQRPANDSSSSSNKNSSQPATTTAAANDADLGQNHVACDKKIDATATVAAEGKAVGAGEAVGDAGASGGTGGGNISTHHNLKLTPLLSKSGQPAPEVIAAATALHQRRGATTKGKTQDDQNVGKRLKKKKVSNPINQSKHLDFTSWLPHFLHLQ